MSQIPDVGDYFLGDMAVGRLGGSGCFLSENSLGRLGYWGVCREAE